MPTDREWAQGFLQQAEVDLRAACALGTQPASVFAMLMQMVFEKFAKAALLRTGAISYEAARSSHKGASTMVAVMRLQRGVIAPIGGPHVWSAAFEVVEALERAQPSFAKGFTAQLEYPWETTAGAIAWPERDLPIAQKLANPNSRLSLHVVDFAIKIQRNFDAIFP